MAVCPRNGTLIVQGEINKLLIAMKRGTTWSAYSQQDEKIEALLKKFNSLKVELNNVDSLHGFDSVIILEPFLEVITSDQTSSSVTSLALVSVNTFLSYALIDPGGTNVAASVCKIAEAVTRAKFSSSLLDSTELDSVVLMRILMVLRNLVISPIGVFLTNENVCEIMSSVFSFCFQTRLTDLLRNFAEHCLKEIVQCLFTRLSQFSEDEEEPSNLKSISTRSDGNHTRQHRQKKISQGDASTPAGSEVDTQAGNDKTPSDVPASETTSLATSPLSPLGPSLDIQGPLSQPSEHDIVSDMQDSIPQPSETEDHRMVDQRKNENQNGDEQQTDEQLVARDVLQSQGESQTPLNETLIPGCPDSKALLSNAVPSQIPGDSTDLVTAEMSHPVDLSQSTVDSCSPENPEDVASTPSEMSAPSRPNHLNLAPSDPSLSTEEAPLIATEEFKGTGDVGTHESSEAEPTHSGDPAQPTGSGDPNTQAGQRNEAGPVAELDPPEEYVNQQGVRFTASDPVEEGVSKGPYGIVSVRELLRCLVQLCDPHNKNNSESMIHIGLTLLTVALEVGADSIANFPSLMAIVKDDLCKYLIGLLLIANRLTIFSANLQLLFLVFESMRHQLKFQFEMYLTRLLDIIASDNQKFRYEMKEIALESIVQLWRIPGLVTELYLNYDCDLYCPNLYEKQTNMLSKNCFPVHGIYNFHLLSLDALLTVIDSIENFCKQKTLNENSDSLGVRTKAGAIGPTATIPSHEDLMAIKRKKKLLTKGTEQFNLSSKKGIKFLQEEGLLSTPLDPTEVVHFLRENPHLDKKTIGEYLSNRSNLPVLDQFVKSFDFTNTRIDVALRMYLETFRLPGESPLISLLMEQFADHWHKSNDCPFANSDAAFTLVYAIIMLNVDQHNHNVKRQNNPMTVQGFKKNLAGVNGGADFDPALLEDIYKTIKEDEIVMPAEHTGRVRDNYLWKVLLRRSCNKEGLYITAPGGSHNNYNHDLFSVIFKPTVAALSYVFDKTSDSAVCTKAMTGFRKCAMISAYYGMSNEFDFLTQTLCKFSTLLNVPETPENQIAMFGCNPKARISTKTVFDWAHRHGDILREGWKPMLACILQLYKWKLLPKILVEAEDFLELSGKISLLREDTSISTKTDKGFFSTFYNSLSLIAFAADQPLQREPTSEEQKLIEQAHKTIMECPLEVLITESKFFRLDSLQEFVKALIAASYGPEGQVTLETTFNEDTTVFFLELLLKVVIQNRDRASPLWVGVRDHLYTLLMRGAATDQHFLVERTIVGVLRLAIRLMSREEMSPVVLQSLRMLLRLKYSNLARAARHIAYGLHELLKSSAANIHACADWELVFTLLECVGAGRPMPRLVGTTPSCHETGAKSDGEVTSSVATGEEDSGLGTERGYTSDSELVSRGYATGCKASPELSPNTGSSWILVGREGEIQPAFTAKPGTAVSTAEFVLDKDLYPHDPFALVKCCESLAFLVRDAAHVTPYNFEACVRCIRTFVEAILETGEKRKPGTRAARDKPRRKLTRKRSTTEERAKSPTRASSPYDADESDDEELPSVYPRVYIQLLDLMHTLHIRTAQIYRWWADENPETEVGSLWSQGWCPLLQGIARLCCDTRKEVRMSAITYLQRALLVHDLQTLSGDEWESCFRSVLFPLLAKLLEDINEEDVVGMEETRMRAATLLSKVFLHHLTPLLVLPTFTQLWLHILDLMDRYMHADGSDLLGEAIPESLKNILLVMDSAKVFSTNDSNSYLWTITWDRIGRFLPHLKEELFKSHPTVEGFETISAPPSLSPPDPASTYLPPGVNAPSNFHATAPNSCGPTAPPTSLQPTSPNSYWPMAPPNNFQPTSQNNFQPTTPQSNFQPTSQNNFQPTTPQSNFQPTSQNNFQPTTPQNTFQPTSQNNFQPTTPQSNFQPTSQNNFQPTTPQSNFQPTSQHNFQPSTPQTSLPTAQQNVFPYGHTSNISDSTYQHGTSYPQQLAMPPSSQTMSPNNQTMAPTFHSNLGFRPVGGYQAGFPEGAGPYYLPSFPPSQTGQATSLSGASLPSFLPTPLPPSSSYSQVSSVYTLGMRSSAAEQGVESSRGMAAPPRQDISVQGMAGTNPASLQNPASARSFLIPQSGPLSRTVESDLPLSKVSAPQPIINIVTAPQSFSSALDPGAPPQLTEEVVSPASAISVPARHAAPVFPQLISTPLGRPPHPLSAFVPSSSNSSPFHPPLSSGPAPLYTIYKGAPGGTSHSQDSEGAKNFLYQNLTNPSIPTSENIFMGNPPASNQNIGSPPRTASGILLNPDLSSIAGLPSVVSRQDS